MAFLDENGVAELWGRVGYKYAPRGSAWDKIQSYETAGSYTWTAPDLFGDGRKYKIGVLVIGGGGSGGATVSVAAGAATSHALGGASGRSTAFVMEVTPGNTYAVVVGAGGASVSASNSQVAGKAGGTSSFNGKTAAGGSGGTGHKGEQTEYTTVLTGGQLPNLRRHSNYGGSTIGAVSSVLVGDVTSCINPFEGTRILGAGGSAYSNFWSGGSGGNSYNGGKNPLNSSKGGGNGSYAAASSTVPTGVAGNEAGCGGGAAANTAGSGTKTAKSGAGAAGAVYIYVLGGDNA